MIKEKYSLNYIVDLILAAFLSFSLTYALTTSLIFSIKPVTVFAFSAVFILFFSIVFSNKLSVKISVSAAGIFIILGIVILFINSNLSKFIHNISVYFSWLANYLQGFDNINTMYAQITAILLCILITVFIYLFAIKYFNFLIILTSGLMLFTSQWALNYFVSFTPFYVFIFLMILYYFKYIYAKNSMKERANFVNPSAFILWAAPVIILIFVFSSILPSKPESLQWKWLDSKMNSVYNYFDNNYFNSKTFNYFSIELSGFGNKNRKLGGKVALDNTLVLKVDAPKVLYLKGAIRDLYNGSTWFVKSDYTTRIQDLNTLSPTDIEGLVKGTPFLSGNDYSLLRNFKKQNIKITFENLATKSLFIPDKSVKISFSNLKSPNLLTDSNEIITSDRLLSKRTSYSIEMYDVKYDDENLIKYLRKSKQGLYLDASYNIYRELTALETEAQVYTRKILSNYTSSLSQIPSVNPPVTFALTGKEKARFNQLNEEINKKNNQITELIRLQSISQGIYSKYLQLPANLPARVKNLAFSITNSYLNNYDKAKAIEKYFYEKYSYTLSPGITPNDRDFVDYFLFDQQEGYCTYFATSMAILLRSVGIPARYIEGYVLPSLPEAGKTYKVTNERAHAWVEAYFEGFGWLPFEPTPPFSGALYNTTTIEAKYDSRFNEDHGYDDYLNALDKYNKPKSLKDIHTTNIKNATENKNNYSLPEVIIISIIITLILSILVFIFIYNYFKDRLYLLRLKKMSSKDSVLQTYNLYIKCFSVLGIPMDPGETPTYYAKRIDSSFCFDKNHNFESVSEIFVLARYSRNEITENDKLFVFSFYPQLKLKTKQNIGRMRYFLYKYYLNKF